MSWRIRLLAVLIAAFCLQGETARYYVVFLRPYPNRKDISKSESKHIQQAHMAFIQEMADDGDLIAAGPCEDTPTTLSGLFVFNDVGSLKDARYIAIHDPTVRKLRNTIQTYAWDGPPGFGEEYIRLHKADPKTPANMQMHPLALIYRGTSWDKNDRTLPLHVRYMERLRAEGKFGAAGDFETPDDLRELAIFKTISMEDAQTLLNQDPAVKAQVLRVEWHRWLSADHVLPW